MARKSADLIAIDDAVRFINAIYEDPKGYIDGYARGAYIVRPRRDFHWGSWITTDYPYDPEAFVVAFDPTCIHIVPTMNPEHVLMRATLMLPEGAARDFADRTILQFVDAYNRRGKLSTEEQLRAGNYDRAVIVPAKMLRRAMHRKADSVRIISNMAGVANLVGISSHQTGAHGMLSLAIIGRINSYGHNIRYPGMVEIYE
jgi:hypothetical protein